MAQIWGWNIAPKEELPLLDRLLLDALESDRHKDRARMCDLIATYTGDPKMTVPLPETIAKVEAVFGSLDWDALKTKEQKRYKQSHCESSFRPF